MAKKPKIMTVLDENKREDGIELFITDYLNEGRQVRLSLESFLRKFGTPKQRTQVRDGVHAALRLTPEFPTLRQLHDDGEEGEHYSIDDGMASNSGDGCIYIWKGRKFEVCVYNGAGEHAAGETKICEIPPDDEIHDIGAALDPKQAHDAEEEAKKNRK
jgi:hypothetical protein